MKRVWDTYKRFSAVALAEMTHGEPPWKDARGDLPPQAESSSVISHESLRRYFIKH